MKYSELLIESEAQSAESLVVRSAESPSDVVLNAPKACAGGCESQSGFYYIFILMCAWTITVALW